MNQTLRTHLARRPRGRAPGSTSSSRSGRRTASAATSSRATSTASARSPRSRRTASPAGSASALGPDLLRYAVERGSIGLGGVSLTVSGLGEDWLEVSLIPETLERTTLGEAAPGRELNVESDVVAKYVERLVAYRGEGKEQA